MSEKNYLTEGQLTEEFPVFTKASRLHRARAMEQNHINNFMAMRATATRLIARNPKAAGIVREIDATLAKLQLAVDGFSGYVEDHGAKEAFVNLEVDQGQQAVNAAKRKQLINKGQEAEARTFVDGLPKRESQVADRYLQFCLELSTWARDAVFENRALECNELEQALKKVHSTMFKRAGGSGFAITTQLRSMLVVPDND